MAGNAPRALAITALALTFLASSFMLSTWPSLGTAGSDEGEIGDFEGDIAGSTQNRLIVRLRMDIDGRFEAARGISVIVERTSIENSTADLEPLLINKLTDRRGIARILLPRGTFTVSVEVFEIGKQKVIDINATSQGHFLQWIFHKRSISPELMTFLDQYGNPSQNEPSELFKVSYDSLIIGQEFEKLGFGSSDGGEIELTMIEFSTTQQTDHLVLRADAPIDISRRDHSVDANIIVYWVTTREVIR